jgi:hypothetical protein
MAFAESISCSKYVIYSGFFSTSRLISVGAYPTDIRITRIIKSELPSAFLGLRETSPKKIDLTIIAVMFKQASHFAICLLNMKRFRRFICCYIINRGAKNEIITVPSPTWTTG